MSQPLLDRSDATDFRNRYGDFKFYLPVQMTHPRSDFSGNDLVSRVAYMLLFNSPDQGNVDSKIQ